MPVRFQLEYWRDGRWFAGRLRHVPGVFSQGATLEELEDNIRDAYRMMLAGQEPAPAGGPSRQRRSRSRLKRRDSWASPKRGGLHLT